MMRKVLSGALLSGALLAGLAGCESEPRIESKQAPSLSLSANHDRILTGERTTVLMKSRNLLGREPQVTWHTTLGEITPIRNSRGAHFTSDTPGVAIITAEVQLDDGRVIGDEQHITVNALRW